MHCLRKLLRLLYRFLKKSSLKSHGDVSDSGLELRDGISFTLRPLEASYSEDDWFIISFCGACTPESRSESPYYPQLRDESEILTDTACLSLLPFLPSHVRLSPWYLAYSTTLHGYGLKNLYRHLNTVESPTVLVIKDMENHVFGAITSCPPRVSRHFCGNGQSAVFALCPDLKIYKWTEACNYHILKGDLDGVSVGSVGGAAAIWLDEDLYRGRTQACDTFFSDPLCVCGDFIVNIVEVWSFSDF